VETTKGDEPIRPLPSVPWFGARQMARALATEPQEVRAQRDEARGVQFCTPSERNWAFVKPIEQSSSYVSSVPAPKPSL
jgi:hypothetical protein